MTYTAPDHYSYNFKFDIKKLPAQQKDRVPTRLAIWGLMFGFMFFAIGFVEILMYFLSPEVTSYEFKLPQGATQYKNMMLIRYSFDTFILLLGGVIMVLSVMMLLRYKKIFFDGEKIKIVHRLLKGDKYTEIEDLYNYLGVLLKAEHYNFGLINRNRYIIELYHKDKNKRVPLYISTSGRNIREIWEYYAEKLKMPALFITDSGLVSRHHGELNKTLKDMAKKWQLKESYATEDDIPNSIKCRVKNNKVIVKKRYFFFDAYSVLQMLGIALLAGAVGVLMYFYEAIVLQIGIWWFCSMLSILMVIIIFSLLGLFSKDVLIVTKHDIILGHNVLFLRIDAEFLSKQQIESVDVGYNPTTDRYYLSVISHNKSFVFGKNMPVDDLRWVQGYIIREIVKQ